MCSQRQHQDVVRRDVSLEYSSLFDRWAILKVAERVIAYDVLRITRCQFYDGFICFVALCDLVDLD